MPETKTNLEKTLSEVEQGEVRVNTPIAPLKSLKPAAVPAPAAIPASAHGDILDSLLNAINPKPAAASIPFVENAGPGDSKPPVVKQARAAQEPVAEASADIKLPSIEKAKEDAALAINKMFQAGKESGMTQEQLMAEIAAFAKEQTGEHVGMPTPAQGVALAREENINAIDEEAPKDDIGNEGLHALENKNMDGLLQIAGLISNLSVIAGDNPFAKKDDSADDKGAEKKDDKKPALFEKKEDSDDKEGKGEKEEKDDKEEKKDNKKPAPFEKKEKSDEPKEEKSEGKSEEKDEIKELKEALKIMEKFLSKEEKSGDMGPEAEIAKEVVEGIKELAGEEVAEKGEGLLGGPVGLEMEGPMESIEKAGEEPKDMFGAPKTDLAKDLGDTMKPGGLKPIPTIKPNMTIATFKMGDRVLNRSAEASDEDAGKIVAVCANDKYVVDWGTEIPTEEHAKMLMLADAHPDKTGLFNNAPVEVIAPVQPEGQQMAAFEDEETKVLSGMSFADAITRMSEDYDTDCEVMHIGTGLKGKIVSRANDRLVIDFGGKEAEYWPNEVNLFSRPL